MAQQVEAINDDRVFRGVRPGGISWCDKTRESAGDYLQLAFLDFAKLQLTVSPHCKGKLKEVVTSEAAAIQAKKGEQFEVSSSGQTVTLGYQLP